MGYIDNLPYGLEFFSTKNSENNLYYIASIFEKLNNLDITNSPLTPNLYEIPSYITELKKLYENNLNNKIFTNIINKTKSYFLEYSKNDEKTNEEQALALITEYETVKNPLKEINIKTNLFINFKIALILIIVILGPIFIAIYLDLKKKIKKIFTKKRRTYGKRNQKKNAKS